MSIFNDRMRREAKTIKVMVAIYCKHHHGLQVLDCNECRDIQNYALDRLYRCPFQEGKTSCKKCPIHCYKPDMKEHVRKVMRYSGPRMMLRHPVLTIFHFIDERQEDPGPKVLERRSDILEEICPGPVQEPTHELERKN